MGNSISVPAYENKEELQLDKAALAKKRLTNLRKSVMLPRISKINDEEDNRSHQNSPKEFLGPGEVIDKFNFRTQFQ